MSKVHSLTVQVILSTRITGNQNCMGLCKCINDHLAAFTPTSMTLFLYAQVFSILKDKVWNEYFKHYTCMEFQSFKILDYEIWVWLTSNISVHSIFFTYMCLWDRLSINIERSERFGFNWTDYMHVSLCLVNDNLPLSRVYSPDKFFVH